MMSNRYRSEAPEVRHCVQFYGSDIAALGRGAGGFLAEALTSGHAVLSIVTDANWRAIASHLEGRGIDVRAGRRAGSIVVLDAAQSLAAFLVDGRPDSRLFDATIGETVREAVARDPGVRLYGEMVGLLWLAGERDAAVLLEGYWNDLLATTDAPLYCSYPLDVLGDAFHRSAVDEIMCAHDRLVPSDDGKTLTVAVRRGMEKVLGEAGAEQMRALMRPNHRPAWGAVPEAESTILWLRNNLPGHAEEITAVARAYFGAAMTGRT